MKEGQESLLTDNRRDGDTMAAWLREAAEELDKAHAFLDLGVARSIPGNEPVECTLAARIALLADRTAE